jgi:cellulose synthase/poly-beta-1,6-N-acetylglucosamine synthase-like glycosyltransferase
MKISYAITVCNEYEEIQKLISTLFAHSREEDEIVVLFDKKAGTSQVWNYLVELQNEDWIRAYPKSFKDHFADWKNNLTSLCSGDYIFQIDADEIPHQQLVETLPEILELNPSVELFLTPRINTVEGLTQFHINKWRWNVDNNGWVNWPDYQWRIWKNKPEIKWINKVHERLEGFKSFSHLPAEEQFSLNHPKSIERQEKQNDYYDTL